MIGCMSWFRCVLSCIPLLPLPTGTAAHFLHMMQGRYLSIICWDGKLHCLDSSCSHAGGPLVSWLLNQLLNSWLRTSMLNAHSARGGRHASGGI